MNKEKLHIYARVSDPKSAKMKNSIEAQQAAGEKTAERLGFEPVLEREGDETTGTSASKDTLDWQNPASLRDIIVFFEIVRVQLSLRALRNSQYPLR